MLFFCFVFIIISTQITNDICLEYMIRNIVHVQWWDVGLCSSLQCEAYTLPTQKETFCTVGFFYGNAEIKSTFIAV